MTGEETPSAAPSGNYAVALACRERDKWQHNALFIDELAPAFAAHGVALRPIDYLQQPRELMAALRDEACRFCLCFNGFGSELQIGQIEPGRFTPAFEGFGKPLFDLMHDCPAHETMAHQVASTSPSRSLLLTDYGYVGVAKAMGMPDARFVPSITFPATLAAPPRPHAERSIGMLLPMGIFDPNQSKQRHIDGSYRSLVYRQIFDAVVDRCMSALNRDPLTELFTACRTAGVVFDLTNPDARFLLTTVLDYVKFERRRRLLHAIAHLPVTVITDEPLAAEIPGSRLTFLEPRTAAELLVTMTDARGVICPLPHMTGYHERAMGAFTAGAAVVASPNHILETEFNHGRGVLTFRSERDLVEIIENALADDHWLEAIATRGREIAMARFAPARFAETVLSLMQLEWSPAQTSGRL